MQYLIIKMKEKQIYPILTDNQCNWVVNLYHSTPTHIYNKLLENNIVIYKCKGGLSEIGIQIAIFNKSYEDIDELMKYF